MKHTIFLTAFLALAQILHASQDYYQTLRGRVTERETLKPISFATVAVSFNGTVMGGITDERGDFRIEKVPVGRITLMVSFMGFETITIQNVEVTTGRETIVNVEMVESAIKLEGVEIRASSDKERPQNTFAVASARTFSIEEAQRYASSYSDVSRMAMNFAGVKSTNDTQNEIVIRGNSPVGMLFRLDGIDIPNPNHYGDGGISGGVVSMLNVNVLANSDFLTGAFPAEYSNTISGIFDLKMRNGNNQKHEFVGQLALMGTEFGAEGPISKENGSSYLVNYRYSTAELLNSVVDLRMTGMPDYQDGSFKLNFPSKNGATTSIIGFGGKSVIALLDSDRDTTKPKPDMVDFYNYETDEFIDNYTGVLGITHNRRIGESAYLRAIVSASTISNAYRTDSLSTLDRSPFLQKASVSRRTKYSARVFVNKRIDNRNNFRAGITLERHQFQLKDSIFVGQNNAYFLLRDFGGHDFMASPYVQWQHRFSQKMSVNSGLTSVYQHSTGKISIEPRLGFRWEPTSGQNLTFAYGLHTLSTPAEVLQQQLVDEYETLSKPNSGLGFMHSHHFVAGYDRIFGNKIRLKSELYYQHIVNVPVEIELSSFSMLNRGSQTVVDFGRLDNSGTGFNYGVELTAEKFMDKGTYFLATLSLYESKYRGSDNELRNTAFNGNFVFNLLAGKEFKVGRGAGRYVKKLNIDGKINFAGGQRFSPIDMEASREIGYTQYDHTRAFSEQMPNYFTSSLRVGYKLVGKRATQEIALSVSNLTNHKNVLWVQYDRHIDGVKNVYQFGAMPDLMYRIVF
jgi:hypothetical protein